VSAVDSKAKAIFERLYWVPGLGPFEPHHSLTGYFSISVQYFSQVAPHFLCEHNSPSNLAESRYPQGLSTSTTTLGLCIFKTTLRLSIFKTTLGLCIFKTTLRLSIFKTTLGHYIQEISLECPCIQCPSVVEKHYGVATISRLLKIHSFLLQKSPIKETIFKKFL